MQMWLMSQFVEMPGSRQDTCSPHHLRSLPLNCLADSNNCNRPPGFPSTETSSFPTSLPMWPAVMWCLPWMQSSPTCGVSFKHMVVVSSSAKQLEKICIERGFGIRYGVAEVCTLFGSRGGFVKGESSVWLSCWTTEYFFSHRLPNVWSSFHEDVVERPSVVMVAVVSFGADEEAGSVYNCPGAKACEDS